MVSVRSLARMSFATFVAAIMIVDLGELCEIAVDLRERCASLIWTLKRSAWMSPTRPTTSQRSTVARLALRFLDVRSLVITGELIANAAEPSTLDFIEYSRNQAALNEIRILMLSSAEILLIAQRCELRIIAMP